MGLKKWHPSSVIPNLSYNRTINLCEFTEVLKVRDYTQEPFED